VQFLFSIQFFFGCVRVTAIFCVKIPPFLPLKIPTIKSICLEQSYNNRCFSVNAKQMFLWPSSFASVRMNEKEDVLLGGLLAACKLGAHVGATFLFARASTLIFICFTAGYSFMHWKFAHLSKAQTKMQLHNHRIGSIE
jgi:hypothetical protein